MKRMLRSFLLTTILAAPVFAATSAPSGEPKPVPPVFPAPIVRVLPNGLRVVVFADPRLAVVQMQLLVPAGGSAEPDSLSGIAALTAGLVSKGTSSRSAEQFAAELATMGATINSSSSRDYALVACGVRATSFEPAIELLSDAAINLLLSDDAFAELRRSVAQQLGLQRQSATAIADDRVWPAAFGQHPYGHLPSGDIQTLLGITRDQVRDFYRSRWRPDRAVITISGDVVPERAFAAATEWFGRWSGKTTGGIARSLPAPMPGAQIVDLPGARWSEARLAWVGPGLASDDLEAWQLLAAGLEQNTLPPGARTSFETLRDASLLVVSVGAPTDSLNAVLRRVRESVRKYAAHPPAQAALDAVRRRVAQSYPLTIETIGAYASQWQAFDYAGRPANAIAHHLGRLSGPVDISKAAHALAQPAMLLVAGPGDLLRESISGFGDVKVVPFHRTPIEQVDTLAAPTPEQARRGKAAIAAAVVAHGGAAKLAAAHTIVSEGEITLYAKEQEFEGQFSLVSIDPDRMSFATKVLQFESRQVLVGNEAWTLATAESVSVTEVDSAGVAGLQFTRGSEFIHLLRAAQKSGAQAARRGSEILRGRTCDLVDFRTSDGMRWRFALDAATHRISAVDGGLGPDLKWHDRRVFSQHVNVNGLWLPSVEERYSDGERVSRFITNQASINQTIDPALFARPRIIRGNLLPSESR